MHSALMNVVRAIEAVMFAVSVLVFFGLPASGDPQTPAPSPSANSSEAPSPSPTAALSAPSTSAPSPTPAPTSTPRTLDRIAVKAASRDSYEIPASALQRLGARTIADALRFIPGVVVLRYGTTGALDTVQMRGASASQTLVMLDGRPVNEGDTGVTDFSSMPLDSVDHIQVIQGGLSTQYGSGAVGGVIRIFSTHPLAGNAASAYAQVGYQGAFRGGVDGSIATPHGGLRIDATTNTASNVFDYPSFAGIAGGTRTNNNARLGNVDACVCYDLGRVSAALHLGDNTSDVGVPGSTAFGPQFVSQFARQQRYVDRGALDLGYHAPWASTDVVLYADGKRLHFFDSTPSFPYDTLTTATARGFLVTETLAAGSQNTVRLMYEGRGDRAEFDGTIDTPPQLVATSASTDLSVTDEFHAGRLELEGGARNAHTQGVPATTVPSFSVRQLVGGPDNTYVHASYARAFRAPNLDERYFPGFGNPLLAPEYAASFDVGVVTANDAVRLAATLFGSDTNNLIVNQTIDQAGDSAPFNIGRARVRGYSLDASNAASSIIGVRATYTGYPVARDLSSVPDVNGVLTLGNRLLRRPITTGTLELWRRTGGGDDGIDLLFAGQRYDDEENLHLLPAYAQVGAYVSRSISPHLTMLFRVDNATGQRVQEVFGYPVLGTTFSVRLTAK
jgi:vitamin B12 transporter